MSTIVIMPGGFHPFHAGHMALYNSARQAFPDADLYVAATNSQEERPFPFAVKEKLAKVAGVEPGHFVQVKSPFQAKEITQNYDPEQDVLIFVRSEKDKNESPKPGGTKKDGSPAYFQPYTGKDMQPFGKHAYFAYLPTVKFGPGITSATEIRKAWPTLDDRRKTAMVMSLYPAAQKNQKLATNIVAMLDQVMGGQLDEGWKNIVAGGALALGALGANAQSMPNVNAQQVELTNKYYTALVQRAKEDGRELDRRTLNFLRAKAEDAAAAKFQKSEPQRPQQGFPTQGSERRVSRNIDNFESQDMTKSVSSLSVEQLAHISDKALDDAYHYGRSTPGANFGWLANIQSAKAAKKLIDAGETDIEKISDAIHQGWNVTAAADYKGQLQLDTPTPDDKKLKRAKLAMQSYSQLPEEEKEKDRVVARALLKAIMGDNLNEKMVIGCCPNEDINEGKIKDIEDLLARHAQYYIDKEQKEGPLSGQDIHTRETVRKQLLAKKKRLQSERDRQSMEETKGLPYPGTYEQENNMFKSHGSRRIGDLTSESINISKSNDYLDEK